MNTTITEHCPNLKARSDSSMVDEYQGTADEISGLDPVQIPLWSMNTHSSSGIGPTSVCSDSSMVDEYGEGCISQI